MNNNKLIIAAAGSGKTTYLVKQVLKVKEANVLITTYTEANEEEIRKKFFKKRAIFHAILRFKLGFLFYYNME